ncbi:hypothetical protein V7S43_018688 [Phytophthora oleae]|uniref:GED domain-containing protein n=1 Tax=Phytophthora oleae TaxID=2107226 RepID=A0ABD3EPX8_9STRA
MLEQAKQESKWEREDPKQRFFEENILRWMLLILTRQPDAQFKLIGTKADLVKPPSLTQNVIDNVKERLNALLDNPDGYVELSQESTTALRTLENEVNGDFVAASVNSIQQTEDAIKAAIIAKLDQSFKMPKSFTQVLTHVISIRRTAAARATQQERMDSVIMPVSELCRDLKRALGVDSPKTCKGILRTLHELGDVL